MNFKKILSRIALILAMIMVFSALASCDLGGLFGGDKDEKKDEKGSVKAYIYTDPTPTYADNKINVGSLNDDAWKASNKVPLCQNYAFEPGATVTYIGKIENTGSLTMTYDLCFNTKGEINPIADYISFSGTFYDSKGNRAYLIPEQTQLGAFLRSDFPMVNGTILPDDVYYFVLNFHMDENAPYDFEKYDIGAKVTLTCKSEKLKQTEQDSFGNQYDTTQPTGEWNSAVHTNGSEDETRNDVYTAQLISLGDSGLAWNSTNHSDNSTSSIIFLVNDSGYLEFNYDVDCEGGADSLNIIRNGNTEATFSGSDNGWYSMPVSKDDRIVMEYVKDGSVSEGADTAWVYNISLVANPSEHPSDAETVPPYDETTVSYPSDQIETAEPPHCTPGEWDYYEISGFSYCVDGTWFSTNHDDNSTATLSFHIYRDGVVHLNLRVPSESCDYLRIFVNNDIAYDDNYGEHSYAGMYDWKYGIEIPVSAYDTITFEYSKDGSVSNGDDCAYISDLHFTPTMNDGSNDVSGSIPETEPEFVERPNNAHEFDNYVEWNYNEFTYEVETDPYGNANYIYRPTNHEPDSMQTMEFITRFSGEICFDFVASSEAGCDRLELLVNGYLLSSFSGDYYDVYSFDVSEGDTVTFRYVKDGSVDVGSDTVYVRNLSCTVISDDTYDPETELEFINVEYFSSYTYEDGDGTHRVWYTTNQGIHNSTAKVGFIAPTDGLVTLQYTVSCESDCDYFTIYHNGNYTFLITSGNTSDPDMRFGVEEGDYIEFVYSKDGSGNSGADNVTITDITFHPYS